MRITFKSVVLAAAAVTVFGAVAPSAQAITWCHDYTLWEASARKINENQVGPRTDPRHASRPGLRERLTALGFQCVKTLGPLAPGADGELKPGDAIILGEAHSGFVNRQKRIDHFVQTPGAVGVARTPEDAMRQPNYHGGQTLVDVWNFTREGTAANGTTFRVTPYRNTPVEVWRRVGDLRVTVTWNTATDVDLWVLEPNNTRCFYGNSRTRNGGHLFQDVTAGFGPEEYQMTKAPAGEYVIKVHMYSRPASVRTPTQVTVVVTRNAGTPQEVSQTYNVTLTNRSDLVEVCKERF